MSIDGVRVRVYTDAEKHTATALRECEVCGAKVWGTGPVTCDACLEQAAAAKKAKAKK